MVQAFSLHHNHLGSKSQINLATDQLQNYSLVKSQYEDSSVDNIINATVLWLGQVSLPVNLNM